MSVSGAAVQWTFGLPSPCGGPGWGAAEEVGLQGQHAPWPWPDLHFSIPKLNSFSMLENAPNCLLLIEKGICVESDSLGDGIKIISSSEDESRKDEPHFFKAKVKPHCPF